MAQDWDFDYDPTNVADTDLEHMMTNFASLISSFSGTSAPSNPVDGQLWFDTTNSLFKMYDSGWVTLFDFNVESRASDRHLRFTVIDPNTAYDNDTNICLIPALDAAILISNLEVTCDADPTTELQGDLKYADDFITLANAAVINDFDTTDGARSDSSITSGSVAIGKCVYVSFGASPDADMTQVSFDITYNYA